MNERVVLAVVSSSVQSYLLRAHCSKRNHFHHPEYASHHLSARGVTLRRMRVFLSQLIAAYLVHRSNASQLPSPSPNASLEPSPPPAQPVEITTSYSYGAMWGLRGVNDPYEPSYDAVDIYEGYPYDWESRKGFPTGPPTSPRTPPSSPGEAIPPPPPLATATCGSKTPEQAIRDGDLIAFDCAQHAPRARQSN